jgi:hypothetical protein
VADYNGPDTLTVTTSDGGSTGSGGALTDVDAVAITVNAVNDRPVLDLDANNSSGAAGADYTTSFTEGGTAVAVADLDDLVADVDNSNLAFATVTLANHQPLDLLSITGTLPAGITASAYDPSTGVLTLSGPATPAAYQTALRQVVFGNSSPIPSATDRIVNIVVNDGAASSVAAHAFVHVVPLDTAPALDLDDDDSSGAAGADYTAVFTGGGAAVPVADTDTRVADVDSSSVVSATIRLTNGEANRSPLRERDTADRDRKRLRSADRHPHADRPGAARRLSDGAAPDRVRQQRSEPAHGDARHRGRRQ